jgi:hypothetical protein
MRTRSFKSSSIMAWIGVKRDQEKSLKMYYYICLRVATRRNVIDICKFVDDYIVDIVQKSQLFIFIENEIAGNFEIDFIIQGIINRKI